jgi:3-oxoacyl-[acyl-carrier-protein] synthase-3
MKRISIAGTGMYLPERILTNTDLEKMVDTTDEWIFTRTGIRQRHMAADGQSTSDLGAEAGKRAIADAGLEPCDIDMIIVATVTPDMLMPNTACFVQNIIGAKNAFCFDLEAACSGFVYAMETAKNYILAGAAKNVLVIGAEKLSSFTDWTDRGTCVLFGDGAGAVVLREAEGDGGILSTVMGSDGALTELLMIPAGGSKSPSSEATVADRMHCIQMSGREVFKHAVRSMCDAGQKALEKAGLSIDDIACIIPHQANMRIIQAISDRLGVDTDRFYLNLERVGNISGASIPVALDEAVKNDVIKNGDNVLFVAFGGGFTWGASAVKWEK